LINYGKQTIGSNDVQAVVDTLHSNWLTQGPKVEEFESQLADYCGANFAVAVANGTAGLHLANLAIGTEPKSGVITSPITFLATSNSVIYAQGRPYFADIAIDTVNIYPDSIRSIIQLHPEIKGIIPVHFAGLVAELEAIKRIADENNLWIIEDACHALGGQWLDTNGTRHKIGDCSHSDMTVFSFHPVKQITTGEGGAILTNNENIYRKLLRLRTHGMTKDDSIMNNNHGGWYYEMHELGYNYRITDIQAALGIEQLKRNDQWIRQRRELVQNYDDAFNSMLEIQPQIHPDKDRLYSYHLYIVQAERRKELYQFLRSKDIYTQVHYIPIHLQPYYQRIYGYRKGDFPNAEKYYDNALSLPLYPSLSLRDQVYVINCIKEFYAHG